MKNILEPLIDAIEPDEIFTLTGVADTLEQTIKKDVNCKLITFLAMLSGYTKESAYNVTLIAPSSTGKSYIPMEVAKLFPKEDVLKYAYSSPTAFFHQAGEYNKETNVTTIDLSGKVLIFQDMPHMQLLERLRPMLSHDEKVLRIQITDKNQKGGHSTKQIDLIGYPAVVFCSANSHIDEQESTRFILLSPEFDQEKIREGIATKVLKDADPEKFSEILDRDKSRAELKRRIRKIKSAEVNEIKIRDEDTNYIQTEYTKKRTELKPRHQRDIGKLISIIKAIALLNYMYKERVGNNIYADRTDIDEALRLWDEVAMPQELNLPPFIFNAYWDVIVPYYLTRNELSPEPVGITRSEITASYYHKMKVRLDPIKLRQQILPALRDAGLIYEVEDKEDKRNKLVFATMLDKKDIYGARTELK